MTFVSFPGKNSTVGVATLSVDHIRVVKEPRYELGLLNTLISKIRQKLRQLPKE